MKHQLKKIIAIVDFGGQYAHLIASRIRRLGVFSEIISNESSLEDFSSYAGLILSGGPESVYDKNIPKISKEIFSLDIPILGICYGYQLMCFLMEGEVINAFKPEYGKTKISVLDHLDLFKGLEQTQTVWMSHTDEVISIPEHFLKIAESDNCSNVGIKHKNKPFYGIQFHPEVVHTQNGNKILENFLLICNVSKTWNLKDFIHLKKEELSKQILNKNVFMFLSGGVDSTVSYMFLSKMFVDSKIKGVLIDTGFMRKDEVLNLEAKFKSLQIPDFMIYDAKEEFYKALENQTDPERKREIVGNLFIELQSKIMKELNLNEDDWLLGQGTIYPDTIESGETKNSHKIKVHHNRVEIIQKMISDGKVIEPIKDLYKDEVRELGKLLHLEESWINRQPFPGPGLVLRLIGQKKEVLTKHREEIECFLKSKENKFMLDNSNVQILPIASVGVQGDKRTYKNCILVHSELKNWDFYGSICNYFINHFSFVNRLIIEPFSSSKVDLEFNQVYLNKQHSDLLREVDFIVHSTLVEYKILEDIWQFPVALLPLGKDKSSFSIVLRPIVSEEAMTADFYRMKWDILEIIVKRVKKSSLLISNVFYDVTSKPPATIEWE